MAVVLGTSSGFVIVAPTADPNGGTNTTIDGSSVVTKHTSLEGANAITEIGWYRGAGTNTANFEIALYSDNAGVANARLFVDDTNSSSVQGWVITAVNWAISANTVYWLAVQMDAHSGSSTIDSETSGGAGIDVLTSQTTLNDPYGGGAVSDADGMMAIYAKVSVARNLTPGVGELTITGFAPTVFATNHKNILADVGALAISGFAPTVAVSDNKNITAGLGELTITGFEPTVSVTNNLNVSPGVGELTITGFAPTIQTPVNINTDLGSLIITGFEPTVTASDNKNVLPDVGELTITGFAPTVTTGSNTEIQPQTGEIIITGFAPVISTPVNTQTDTGSLEITGFAPTVQTPRNVIPGVAELIIEGFAPTVTISGGEVLVQPDFGELIIEGFAPTVTALNKEFLNLNSGIDNGSFNSEISEGNNVTRIVTRKRVKSKIENVI